MATDSQILNGDTVYMIPAGASGLHSVTNTVNNQTFDTYNVFGTSATAFTIYGTDIHGNITGIKGTPINNSFTLIRNDNNNRFSYCEGGNIISYVSGDKTEPYNLSGQPEQRGYTGSNGINCFNTLFSVQAQGTNYLKYGVPYVLNGIFGNIEVGPSGTLDMNETQTGNRMMIFYKFENGGMVKQSATNDSTIYFVLILILLVVALFFIMKNTSFKL